MKSWYCFVYVVAQFAPWAGGKCHCNFRIIKQSSPRQGTRQAVFLDAVSSLFKDDSTLQECRRVGSKWWTCPKVSRGSDKQNTRHGSPEITGFYHINKSDFSITRGTINRLTQFSTNHQQGFHPAVRPTKNIP